MFRNEYTAKIGFTRLLDRTCSKCGGLYTGSEYAHCPKCKQALVVPSFNTAEGPRKYCFTEVTLYPLMRQEAKDRHAKRTEAAKGLLYVIRMTLWGRYDKERDVVQPDPRTQYLVPKRVIRVLFNNPPTLIPYTANDQTTKVEMKFTFDIRDGDQVEFLDEKQTATALMEGTKTPTPTEAPTPELEALQQQMANMVEAFKKVMPAPDPSDAGMTLTDESDYKPDGATMAQEVSTDPFST